MSRSGKVSLKWADGEHTFRLGIGELRELQEKCDAGPNAILQRLAVGGWYVDDIRETLRLGLIGGGKTPGQALKLIERYVDADDRPLLENAPAAQAVILAAVIGVKDEPLGKAEAAKEETMPTMDASPSPPSMDSAPPSDGPPDRSTTSVSGSSKPPPTDGYEPTAQARTTDQHPPSTTPSSINMPT